jgi:hypothetical protein
MLYFMPKMRELSRWEFLDSGNISDRVGKTGVLPTLSEMLPVIY